MPTKRDTPEVLAAKYIKGCWILKIRLMSSRRLLWKNEFSLIHFEQAVLQIRKITEGYAQLNLLLGQIEHSEIPNKIKNFHEPPKILNALRKIEKKPLLARAKMNLMETIGTRKKWRLEFEDITPEDEKRICYNWNQCGRFLHDQIIQEPMITEDEMSSVLFENRNSLRAEHQWFWNLLWNHAAKLKDMKFFFINFGDESTTSRPIIGKEAGFLEIADFEFHPEMYSDFTGDVDWKDYTG